MKRIICLIELKKHTNSKNISESSINDEIPVCKYENGPVKSDIALQARFN